MDTQSLALTLHCRPFHVGYTCYTLKHAETQFPLLSSFWNFSKKFFIQQVAELTILHLGGV